MFFDNLQVTHTRGRLIEETHYYPFGLTMAGLSSNAIAFGDPENKKKYQQYEFNSDFELNLYESFFRTHDPQIGRFWQLDPKPTDFESLFVAMGNNPIRNFDILGDSIGPKRIRPMNIFIVPVAKDIVGILDTRRLKATNGKYETLLLHTNTLNERAATEIKKFLGDDGYIKTMVVDYHRGDYDNMDFDGKKDFYTSLSKGYSGDKTEVLLGMCWAGGRYFSEKDPSNLPDLTQDISRDLDKAVVYGLKTVANALSFNSSGNFGVVLPEYSIGNGKFARHERAFQSEWSVSRFNSSIGQYSTNEIYKTIKLTLSGDISITTPPKLPPLIAHKLLTR